MEGRMGYSKLERCMGEHRGRDHIARYHDLYRILGYYDENENGLNPDHVLMSAAVGFATLLQVRRCRWDGRRNAMSAA